MSIATMVSFAFNTMIGQITDIAIDNIGGVRFYIIFCICNFTNAVFFWLILPETTKLPLEDMGTLFNNEPWLVPGTQTRRFIERSKMPLPISEGKNEQFSVHEEVTKV